MSTRPGPIVVEGTYEIGMQDQAFLGLEAALAIPDPGGGGVELHIATQWLHEDRKQIAACLGLPEEQVRLVLGGVGGAFGAREDISLQVHTCLLALRLSRPVRMQYSRAESFLGHVHRHPATVWMRHHATADGVIVKVEARYVFDGGAYASTSSAVLLNAITHTQGPYRCPNAVVDGWAVRTNHLPCGAMRGFGVVQACFAHESQLDRLAEACGLDPVEVRLRNAIRTGDVLITGQVLESVAPVDRCIRETAELPLPDEPIGGHDGDVMRLPGGAGRTADTGDIRRGIGWGVAMKNLMYSEGFDDYSTARCRLADGRATIKFATAEVGQGFVTIAAQIARTILGVDDVAIDAIDTAIGSAGSTSASRQTWMSGGAVDAACRAARERLFEHVGLVHGIDPLRLAIDGTDVVDTFPESGEPALRVPVAEASAGIEIDETVEYRHRPTEDLDENGQGNCHVAFAFVAHRAVVDVDPELGLVKVIQVATAQDVGRALNPLSRARPDRRRHRPGPRPGGDGGDHPDRRPDPQRQLHRLPAADDARHAPGRRHPDRGTRSAGAARRQGRRRAAVHLGHAGDRGRDPRRPAPGRRRRQAPHPGPRPPRRHRVSARTVGFDDSMSSEREIMTWESFGDGVA